MSEKRLGPYAPDSRPFKRRATSSPEEGEVDDGPLDVAVPPAHPLPPKPTLAAPGSAKFKVPFPFKKSGGGQNGSGAVATSQKAKGSERNDKLNDWDVRRQLEESSRQSQQARGKQRPIGDRYLPGSSSKRYNSEVDIAVGCSDSYVPPRGRSRSRSRSRERERDRNRESDRHWVPNSEYSNDYGRRHYRGASPPQARHLSSPPTRTPSDRSPRSPPREMSPPSRSHSPPSRSEHRQKHRLPTPRSSALISPNYSYGRDREQARPGESEREAGRSRGDHYEPYGREIYRDRERDPRGQYFRDEADDWDRDRHYRPSDYDDRSYSRYPQSPAYRPVSPRHRTLDVPRTPPGPPPGSPPPPPPSNFRIKSSSGTIRPPSPSTAEKMRAREAQDLAMVRPGAPRDSRSPPSIPIRLSSQKATPIPVSKPQPADASTPSVIAKKRRVPAKRTREQEKAAYQRIFVGCGSREDYDVMTKLGEGTFGHVSSLVIFRDPLTFHNVCLQ